MKKLILLSVIAISVLVARDCRYEERELNMLIQQYEDLEDEYDIAIQEIGIMAAHKILNREINIIDANYQEADERKRVTMKYNIRFNRLNQRIEQQKQRLNNCRNGK